jgi:energy-coupling factor transporter ATP-binding protein EcfA2
MSASVLKKLTIEHLRGAVTRFALSFEKGKKLTVVYGPNGTGKTSLCDALELLSKGKVGSLENRGLGKTNRYWPSLGKAAGDVAVVLEAADSTCTARIQKSDVVVLPAEARPRVEVLRRSQILGLVQAKPGERYEAIRRFIDVSGVEASEDALRTLIKSLQKNRDVAVARVQENQDAIRHFWETAGKPGRQPVAWAEQEAVRDTTALQAELQALDELRAAYARLAEDAQRLRDARVELQSAQQAATVARRKLEGFLATVAAGSADLVAILEAAKSYLDKRSGLSQCPLCESAERVAGLTEKVTQRLQQFASLQAAQREAQAADRAVEAARQKNQSVRDEAVRHSQSFEEIRRRHAWAADVPLPPNPCPTAPEDLDAWLGSTFPLPEEWTAIAAERQDKKQFVSMLQRALETCEANVLAQKELDILLPRLERTLEIVEEERRRFTDGVLAEIAQEVGRLYEAVHPGEGLHRINLELDPKKRASLEIGADFRGLAGTPPQAYFSDSHLETLGLCIFLALAARDDPARTILVLDDVLSSVDEPHVERLLGMLYVEALKFRHCLLTTHHGPWGWLQTGRCQFVELGNWTVQHGLAMTPRAPDVERLKPPVENRPKSPKQRGQQQLPF